MYGTDYDMIYGMQKKKFENAQRDLFDLEKENEIMRNKLEELGVDVKKLLKKEIIIRDLFGCEEMYENLLIDFNSSSTSNLATLERYSKKNERIENLDFFVSFLFKKYEQVDIDEKIFILRCINKSLNYYISYVNIVLYSKYLLEMLESKGQRHSIVLILDSFWIELFNRYNNFYPNEWGDDTLKEKEIKFNSKDYKKIILGIYDNLIKLYISNNGNIQRSIGIAIERCNFEEFEKIMKKTEIKKLYKIWSVKSLYNKEKWK